MNWEINPSISWQFGDFIGGVVGAIWALAGVILFYLALEKQKEAIKVQKESLDAQLEELQFTRVELEKTREVFEKQNQTQEFLQFESSFFSLIDLRQPIFENFSHYERTADHGLVPFKGQAAIKVIADRVKMLRSGNDNDQAYSNLFDRYSGYLIPYFNLLTEIMVKIEHSPFDDRITYFTDIFYSLFSDNEFIIIGQYRANQKIDYRFDKLYKGSEIGT